jgi:hypothetical protein
MDITRWLVKATPQYVGGSTAGTGLGIILGPVLLAQTELGMRWIAVLGFALLVLGAGIALKDQQKSRR